MAIDTRARVQWALKMDTSKRFSGDNPEIDPRYWVEDLEDAWKLLGGTPVQFKEILRHVLDGTALQWHRLLSEPEKELPWALGEHEEGPTLREAFLSRFTVVKPILNASTHFVGFGQRLGESVRDYHTRLNLTRSEFIDNGGTVLPDEFFKDVLFNGLTVPIKRFILGKGVPPTEMIQLLEMATLGEEVERELEAMDGSSKKGSVHVSSEMMRLTPSSSSSSSTVSGRSLLSGFMETKPRSPYCIFCLSQGDHSTYNCGHLDSIQRERGHGGGGEEKGEFNFLESGLDTSPPSFLPPIMKDVLFPSSSRRFLVDAGASPSLVHTSVVDEEGLEVTPDPGVIRSLSGTLTTPGFVTVGVTIGGRKMELKAYVLDVMPAECEGILGREMLLTHNLIYPMTFVACSSSESSSSSSISSRKGGSVVHHGGVEDCFLPFMGGTVTSLRSPVHIDTGGAYPRSARAPRWTPSEEERLLKLVRELEQKGVVERASGSEWASRPKLVEKGNGDWRMTLNLIPLNEVSAPDVYPPPHMDTLRWRCRGAKSFCKLDLTNAFFQLPLDISSRKKTAFHTPDGMYQFKVMPQGWKNSSAIFQRTIDDSERIGRGGCISG